MPGDHNYILAFRDFQHVTFRDLTNDRDAAGDTKGGNKSRWDKTGVALNATHGEALNISTKTRSPDKNRDGRAEPGT